MRIRILVALAVLVSAIIHLRLWFDVFREAHVVGPAMLVNFFAGVVIAALLVTWRHWLAPLLALGFGVATLAAFLISTTSAGLYGVHERWIGWQVYTAAATEIIAIVGTLVILWRQQPQLARHQTVD